MQAYRRLSTEYKLTCRTLKTQHSDNIFNLCQNDHFGCMLNGLSMRENLSSGFANNKGADQSVHPRSLISAFVIRLLKSTISNFALSEFSG